MDHESRNKNTLIVRNKLIINCKIHTGQQVLTAHSILVNGGKIISIQPNSQILGVEDVQVVDLGSKNIGPGLIDIQINGGQQCYFSHQPNQQTLQDIYQTCLKYGTPFILPTLTSSPLQFILVAIEQIRKYRQKNPGVLGMHLEGPFLNPKKKGAHNSQIIRKPTDKQLQTIIQKGKDVIKVITVAPQCLAQQQIEMLQKSGIVISLGHSDLTYAKTQEYFNKGVKLVTHLYNAMNQMGQRQCGTVGAIFDNPDVYASIILDGGHCHYAAARIAYKQKGDKLILISDSSFLGRKKKSFSWPLWSIQMIDGFYRDKEGNLAGAAISMPQAIKNAVENLGITLQQAVKMATSRVAKAIHMQDKIGYIKEGYPATFIVFNEDMSEYQSLML